MSVIRLVAVAAVVFVAADVAFACSSIFPAMVFFDFGSSNVIPSQKGWFEEFVLKTMHPGLPSNCQQIMLIGSADTAEATTPEVRVDIARAEAVRDVIVRAGIPSQSIRIEGVMEKRLLVPTDPNVKEPQNRRVEINWSMAKGRWRCDPATKEPSICGPGYRSCYWELADGTICNFRDVPDPNPAKYSVGEAGEEFK